MNKLALAAAVAWLAGCPGTGDKPGATPAEQAPATQPRSAPAAPVAAKKEDVVKSEKAKLTTIVGIAHRAKLGPLLEGDNGMMVYCMNIGEWPDDVLGKKVRVTGTLSTTDQYKARVTKGGAVSQGTRGGDTVMNDAKWERVNDKK